MDLCKLKSIRSVHSSAVTKLVRKIDAVKQDTDFDTEELTATFENLLQKQNILNNLNEQILNLAEAEDIEITRRRTENVIKKLSQDPKLLKKYGDIIAEQERRGFVETVDEKEQNGGKIHYIPHHPIHKESSTTPIRIVYDCSCRKSPSHPSLNDCLMDTPPKLNDLTKLLVQFRANQFATCTDNEKAVLYVGLS
ncbi:uncharacterized protein [Mytilus edulis]|uniref:uncharacterized protein n=1 Tax=Mytilus edulis TaxID=6550 RepID=UPI0039EE5CD3